MLPAGFRFEFSETVKKTIENQNKAKKSSKKVSYLYFTNNTPVEQNQWMVEFWETRFDDSQSSPSNSLLGLEIGVQTPSCCPCPNSEPSYAWVFPFSLEETV